MPDFPTTVNFFLSLFSRFRSLFGLARKEGRKCGFLDWIRLRPLSVAGSRKEEEEEKEEGSGQQSHLLLLPFPLWTHSTTTIANTQQSSVCPAAIDIRV